LVNSNFDLKKSFLQFCETKFCENWLISVNFRFVQKFCKNPFRFNTIILVPSISTHIKCSIQRKMLNMRPDRHITLWTAFRVQYAIQYTDCVPFVLVDSAALLYEVKAAVKGPPQIVFLTLTNII
jgi:hypothetical protein